MEFHASGLAAVPVLIALVLGGFLMAVFAGWLVLAILDWAIERALRSLDVYREFLAFAGPRVMARMRRRKGKEAS